MAAAAAGSINAHAKTSFAKAAAYDQHRPAYSDRIVQLLLENCGVAGKKVWPSISAQAGAYKMLSL